MLKFTDYLKCQNCLPSASIHLVFPEHLHILSPRAVYYRIIWLSANKFRSWSDFCATLYISEDFPLHLISFFARQNRTFTRKGFGENSDAVTNTSKDTEIFKTTG